MNAIIKKSDKTVIWLNQDPNKLLPEQVYSGFEANTMQAIFCPGYNPKIGQIFKPKISNDIILEFQKKTVWLKSNYLISRELLSWDDEINKELETIKEPKYDIVDERKVYKRFQDFVDGEWIVDIVKEQDSVVPQTLTPAQARLALLAINKLDTVEALIIQDSTPRDRKILWEYATVFERENPVLISLATSLGMSKAAIDELFIQGAKL